MMHVPGTFMAHSELHQFSNNNEVVRLFSAL